MKKPVIYRGWINQPSTLQPLHSFHGKRGIVVDEGDPYTMRMYFSEGIVVSIQAPRSAVSASGFGK